jgi:hypothetical protein
MAFLGQNPGAGWRFGGHADTRDRARDERVRASSIQSPFMTARYLVDVRRDPSSVDCQSGPGDKIACSRVHHISPFAEPRHGYTTTWVMLMCARRT